MVELRGFRTETHYAVTKDGYHINVVRIVNPKNDPETGVFKRPCVFNHGLLESGTIWLINANGVRPMAPPRQCALFPDNTTETQDGDETLYMNGPFMLANHGYDVWVMSMRGTEYSMRHDNLSPMDPQFWNYSLDDFALIDVPTVIDYVRRRTGASKVGYVGHSQATFAILGLLSARPKYSKVIEPVIAVAPVSYFDNVSSIARILMVGAHRVVRANKHGPFPTNARGIRKRLGKFCRLKPRELICQLMSILIAGPGKKMLKGFFSHLPFHTSLKVLKHFGQLIEQRRNLMYDYGPKMNLELYGQIHSPNYPLERIDSDSLCFFSATTDTLSHPVDVERLRERLTVKLYKDITIGGRFNHMDLIVDEDATELVFKPMLEIFESFELEAGGCSLNKTDSSNNPTKKESSNELGRKEIAKVDDINAKTSPSDIGLNEKPVAGSQGKQSGEEVKDDDELLLGKEEV